MEFNSSTILVSLIISVFFIGVFWYLPQSFGMPEYSLSNKVVISIVLIPMSYAIVSHYNN